MVSLIWKKTAKPERRKGTWMKRNGTRITRMTLISTDWIYIVCHFVPDVFSREGTELASSPKVNLIFEAIRLLEISHPKERGFDMTMWYWSVCWRYLFRYRASESIWQKRECHFDSNVFCWEKTESSVISNVERNLTHKKRIVISILPLFGRREIPCITLKWRDLSSDNPAKKQRDAKNTKTSESRWQKYRSAKRDGTGRSSLPLWGHYGRISIVW